MATNNSAVTTTNKRDVPTSPPPAYGQGFNPPQPAQPANVVVPYEHYAPHGYTQSQGMYPSQGPGPYPHQGPGPYPHQGPGPYPHQGPGPYPPQGPGPYPPQGAPYPGQPYGYYGNPQGAYADDRRNLGFTEALLASLACCCCLEACLLF